MNGAPLDTLLGVRKIRDLHTADMKKLVHEYLRLGSPEVDPKLTKLGLRRHPLKAMMEHYLRRVAERDVESALANGNFTQLEDGRVDFRPVAKLDRAILHSVHSFRRAVGRVKR